MIYGLNPSFAPQPRGQNIGKAPKTNDNEQIPAIKEEDEGSEFS